MNQQNNTSFAVDNSQLAEGTLEKNQSEYIMIGNPNVGKSLICTYLSGFYSEVSNYPGTTVEVKTLKSKDAVFVDTPGIYGLGNHNEEERIVKNLLIENNFKVINIACAYSLERDLFLTQQLIDMGFPIVLVLNQIDEAKARGIKIDTGKLKTKLGVEIYYTNATEKSTISELKKGLHLAKIGNIVPEIEKILQDNNNKINLRAETLLALENDNQIVQKYSEINFNNEKEKIYSLRRTYINEIIKECVTVTPSEGSLSTKIGAWLLNPFIGSTTAIVVLIALYQFIGVFVSNNVVGVTEKLVDTNYVPWIKSIVASFHPHYILADLLTGHFGVLTLTIQYLIGILLPLVIGFNIFFSILEDSGYLPRFAVLCDNLMSKIGLNGKSIIPIILGFGCVTMAIISSRILNSSRERLMAITILALTIPCSAKMAMIVSLLAVSTSPLLLIIYVLTIITVVLLITAIMNKLLPGEASPLLIDLPPMRLPGIKNVCKKTYNKTVSFLQEATPIFFLGTFILCILELVGGLEVIRNISAPIVVNILNLPKEATDAFILGLIRGEFGAVQIANMAGLGSSHSIMSPVQVLVSMVVLTLFIPCLATVMLIIKERGWYQSLLMLTASVAIAIVTGGILSYILSGIL